MLDDQAWMTHALRLAELAKQVGEVPVGAILVADNEVIAEGYNCPISTCDPTAHAEIVVLRKASALLQNYRLIDTTLYVTLEPCAMCAGAMVHARIKRLVYGAHDNKAGAVVSQEAILDKPFLNHRVQHQGGILREACGAILSEFFQAKRTLPK